MPGKWGYKRCSKHCMQAHHSRCKTQERTNRLVLCWRSKTMEEMREEGIMKKLGKPVPIAAAVVGVLVITAFIITVILSVTVYRGKDPITMVDGVVLRDLHISHKVPKLTVDLNLSVKNPNKEAFRPTKGTALLVYRGVPMGEAVIDTGEIAAGATKSMTVTLSIMPERLQGNPEIYMEVKAGMVPFNTCTKISCKVKIFDMVKVNVISTGLCGFAVDVKSKTVGEPKCS